MTDTGEGTGGSPKNDDKKRRRPGTVAVFVVSALIVIILAIKADETPPAPPPENALPAHAVAAVPTPENAGTIDPAAIAAWQKAAAERQLDLAIYDVIYVQDPRTYTVMLVHKNANPDLRGSDPQFPIYEITVERGSNRVTAFNVAR